MGNAPRLQLFECATPIAHGERAAPTAPRLRLRKRRCAFPMRFWLATRRGGAASTARNGLTACRSCAALFGRDGLVPWKQQSPCKPTCIHRSARGSDLRLCGCFAMLALAFCETRSSGDMVSETDTNVAADSTAPPNCSEPVSRTLRFDRPRRREGPLPRATRHCLRVTCSAASAGRAEAPDGRRFAASAAKGEEL